MKHILYFFLALSVLSGCQSQPLSPDQWREDIRFFMEQAPKTHISLYHILSKSRFDSIGADLLNRVPNLTGEQITAELVRWVAALGDGHSNLTPPNSHVYPVLPFWFKEGFFIDNAQKEGKAWLGWKLEKINGIPVETIAERLRPYQQRDGEQQVRAQAPGFLVNVEALQAVGVVHGIGKAAFTFKNTKTGAIKTAELEPIELADLFRNRHGGAVMPGDAQWPLYRQHRDKNYWFQWLPDSKTLYFQYNTVLEDQHEPAAEFIQKLARAVEQNPVERFVVDLRWNGGGNLFTSKPFTEFIVHHPKINRRGKLFVILGRHTFSAASFFTTSLELRSQAIFVGEATGASPNHYGDTRPLRLPNSGLQPQLSTIYWQNSFAWDKRPATEPDLPVEPTAADWLANRDAALDAVLAYKPELREDLPVDPALKAKITGRYLYDGDHLIEIREAEGQLQLTSADFIETSLHLLRPGEQLDADVRSLRVEPAGPDRIKLEAFGGSVVLEKAPAGFMLPKDLLLAGKLPEGMNAYRALKKEKPGAPGVSEIELNRLGYEMMNAKHLEAALALFQLNTEFYPGAFNTWDSLAEYYMNTGDTEKAIRYYEKSLALNPDNDNGKKMLSRLR